MLNEISNQKFNQFKSLPSSTISSQASQITNGSSELSSIPISNIMYSTQQLPQYNSTYDPLTLSSSSVLSQQNMAKNLIRKQFDQLSSNLGLLKNYK